MFLAVFAVQEALSPRADRFVVHAPAAIKELAYLDTSFCIPTTTRASGDVQDDATEANRIIITYSSLIAKAADSIDIKSFGQSPPCRLAFPRRLGKPRIEVR